MEEYKKTKEGLCIKIFFSQKATSKNRGYKVHYSLDEFREWLFSQENFKKIYNNWVDSGYKKDLVPSVDRIDDYEGYKFSNIQLITFKQNREKYYLDVKNGINNKKSKAIIGIHKKTGEILEFYSQHEASRKTGIFDSNINRCCNGKQKSAGGYIWKFK